MDNKIDDFNKALDRPEQYSRVNYILVHGVKKSENENIGRELFIKIWKFVNLSFFISKIERYNVQESFSKTAWGHVILHVTSRSKNYRSIKRSEKTMPFSKKKKTVRS